MDGNVLCRLCLEVVPTGYTIFKENIQNIIKTLTSIEITPDDDLPKLSCSKCILNLYFVESIQNSIIKSDEKLRTAIARDGHFGELLKINPIVLLETEEQTDTDALKYEGIDIKEEKYIPVNSIIQSFPENCDVNTANEETAKSTDTKNTFDDVNTDNEERTKSTDTKDTFDENDIRNIIYKKDRNLYYCTVCKEDFRGKKLYMKHKGKHTKKTCEICGVTIRQDNFSKHMMNHKLGQQICDMCGSIHKSLEGLRTHLFHFHNEKKKPYICPECGESFKYSHRLAYHKRKVHTGFRPHQCETCGKRFFDLGTMRKHVKLIHLKLREYHCDYCQKDYSSQYALKVHIRQHTDETPYICEICSEGFRQLVSLKTHMAKHERAARKN